MTRAAAALLLVLVLGGCHQVAAPSSNRTDTPGDRLEAAAIVRGLVADPARIDPTGLYAREGDRVCVVPVRDGYRFGALVRFDDGPGCEAAGQARRVGSTLDVRLGEDCRFAAGIEADRIVVPATLPAGCRRFCSGRASLAALTADRLSDATAEAAALRDAHGRPLCGD